MLKRILVLLAVFAVAGGIGNDAGFAAGGGPLGSVRLEHPS